MMSRFQITFNLNLRRYALHPLYLRLQPLLSATKVGRCRLTPGLLQVDPRLTPG
jgi:hypothetical protein